MSEFIRTVLVIVTVTVLAGIVFSIIFPDAHATVIDYGTTSCYWIGDVLYCN